MENKINPPFIYSLLKNGINIDSYKAHTNSDKYLKELIKRSPIIWEEHKSLGNIRSARQVVEMYFFDHSSVNLPFLVAS